MDMHVADKILSASAPFMFAAVAVVWLIGAVVALKRRGINDVAKKAIYTKLFVACFVAFMGIIFSGIIVDQMIVAAAREEVTPFLKSGIVSVRADGKPVVDAARLIDHIQNMSEKPAHHSHPKKNVTLALQTQKGDLTLTLSRDSQNPQEYWVF